jgi:hypothetical protein
MDAHSIGFESTGNHVIFTLSTAINLTEVQKVTKRSGFLTHLKTETFLSTKIFLRYTKLFNVIEPLQCRANCV